MKLNEDFFGAYHQPFVKDSKLNKLKHELLPVNLCFPFLLHKGLRSFISLISRKFSSVKAVYR